VPTRREPTRTVEVVAVDGEPPDADESGELARSRLPEAAPAPAPAPAPARPVVPALPAPPAATGESRPRREPEPTPDVVHVSIGRVEVRATLAAPAQQPTQKPGPPTSTTEPSPSPREQSPQLDLSAYLRGRRGAR